MDLQQDLPILDDESPERQDASNRMDALREEGDFERPLQDQVIHDGSTEETPLDERMLDEEPIWVDPCEDSSQGMLGLSLSVHGPGFTDVSDRFTIPLVTREEFWGGVAIIDVDNDGWHDIVYTAENGEPVLLQNCGEGRFSQREDFLEPTNITRARSLAFGDIDNDGDDDLYIGGQYQAHLFLNEGGGAFLNVSDDYSMGVSSQRASATFVDINRDGLLDLYETGYENRRNALRFNVGGRFEELDITPGNEPELTMSLGVAVSDVNRDGWPDIWVVNDYGFLIGPSQLFLNRGPDLEDPSNWLFEDVGSQTGFGLHTYGMGVAFGDIDNDGDLDGYSTNIAHNVLLVMEEADESCPAEAPFCGVDRAQEWGVSAGLVEQESPVHWLDFDPESSDLHEAGVAVFCETYCDIELARSVLVGWSVNMFDADHNGWLDIFISNGRIDYSTFPMTLGEPNYLFINDQGTFTQLPEEQFPTSYTTTRGAAVGDLDNDGDLDVVWLDENYDNSGQLRILENHMTEGNWLALDLVGTLSNRGGVGARITVEAGELSMTRELNGGQGFLSADQRAPHFGLAEAENVDRILIIWPSGIVQELVDQPVNQILSIVEPTQ
jgi:hypothetical protein